jgi:hypothetical protein
MDGCTIAPLRGRKRVRWPPFHSHWLAMCNWWSGLPVWAKSVILGSILPASLGILAWIFLRGIPAVKKYLYLRTLQRLTNSKSALEARNSEIEMWECLYQEPHPFHGAQKSSVSLGEIIKHSGCRPWLVKWALAWQQRRRIESGESQIIL